MAYSWGSTQGALNSTLHPVSLHMAWPWCPPTHPAHPQCVLTSQWCFCCLIVNVGTARSKVSCGLSRSRRRRQVFQAQINQREKRKVSLHHFAPRVVFRLSGSCHMPLTQWPVLLSRPFVGGYRLQKSCLFTHDAPTAHRGEVTSVVRYPFLSLTCRRHCVVISHRLTFFFRFPSSHQLLGKLGDLLDRRRRPHQTASNKPTVRCFPPHVIDRPSLEVTLDETF
jgi:hypothetical protein